MLTSVSKTFIFLQVLLASSRFSLASFIPSSSSHVLSSPVSSSTAAYLFINRNDIFEKLRKGPPLTIEEELGCSPSLNYKYFDPLKLANDDNFAFYREAELKHGRVAMLATIGMTFPEWNIPLFGNEGFLLGHPFPWTLSPSNENLKFSDIPCGIRAIPVLPWQGWIQIIAIVGVLETLIFVQQSEADMPGDYGIGYFGLRDKGKNERSLLVELEHGRLAMLAFLFQVISELVMGQTILQQWK